MFPVNNLVTPMLTDLYQLTMAYAYWKSGKHEDRAVFEMFFRKNPLEGEFTIFAGLDEVLRFLENFRFTDSDIQYLNEGIRLSTETLCNRFDEGIQNGYIRKKNDEYEQYTQKECEEPEWCETEYPCTPVKTSAPLSQCDPAFFEWLKTIDCSEVKVHAFREGSVVFPRLPLLRVEGPIAIVQLIETPLLTLINYPSLVATKAARLRLAAGKNKKLLEFGLRRAQGPDGGVSASRYSFIGGFDASSNVTAGKLFGVPVSGTHAHSFVSSFTTLEELEQTTITGKDGKEYDLKEKALAWRDKLDFTASNEGELAAFIAYALAFPDSFTALIDTYDILKSGVPNFICTALALEEIGYRAIGVRIDSGDLAYFSKKTREMFLETEKKLNVNLSNMKIVASNDIDESTLLSLGRQGHEIDVFGIGTHLVTVNGQPSLGGVYKLVEFNGSPRIKISQEITKITLPASKAVYRIYGEEGYPLLDLMQQDDEPAPLPGKKILCRNPFRAEQRAYVIPSKVETMHHCVWNGKRTMPPVTLETVKKNAQQQLERLRQDHLRTLNPTPYKISVSDKLYSYLHKLWEDETPIPTIH